MKNLRQPAFLIGLLSLIMVIIAVGTKSYGYVTGNFLFIAAALLAGATWIMGIINVVSRPDMKPFQKRFWLIIVVAAPFIGAMLFFILHQKPGRLTT